MTRFDIKSLKLGCGMVIGVGSILTIVLLVVAALTFGMSAANDHNKPGGDDVFLHRRHRDFQV